MAQILWAEKDLNLSPDKTFFIPEVSKTLLTTKGSCQPRGNPTSS